MLIVSAWLRDRSSAEQGSCRRDLVQYSKHPWCGEKGPSKPGSLDLTDWKFQDKLGATQSDPCRYSQTGLLKNPVCLAPKS